MFCSLYGFSELINTMEPLKVLENKMKIFSYIFQPSTYFQSFKLLNEISLELDMIISNFDVYKVEYINNKYMVASGIPKENGMFVLFKECYCDDFGCLTFFSWLQLLL